MSDIEYGASHRAARSLLFFAVAALMLLAGLATLKAGPHGPARASGSVQGDVDCSGAADSIDALKVLLDVSSLPAAADCLDEAGDVDCSGARDSIDALRILGFVAGLPFTPPAGCTPIGEPLDGGATPTPTPDPDAPTAEELIDVAVMAGELDEGTAVLYKAYWAFGDPRLPPQYDSSVPGDGDAPDDIFLRPAGLAPEIEAQLDAYLLPPSAPGSWYAGLHGGGAARRLDGQGGSSGTPEVTPPQPSGDWIPVLSPGGRVKVWWDGAAGFVGDEERAQELSQTVDGIWAQYETLLGREPLPDDALSPAVNGGDGLYDIYLAPLERGLYGYVSAFTRVYRETQPCPVNPTFMVVSTTTTIEAQRVTLAHELFHSFQKSFPSVDACGEYARLLEASAAWAQDFVYPSSNLEHTFQGFISFHSASWPGWDPNGYSGFIFLMYVTRTYGNQVIAGIFDRAETMTIPVAVDGALPDGLAAAWKQFALVGANVPPFDLFTQWDGITWHPNARGLGGFPPEYLFLSTDEHVREFGESISAPTTAVFPRGIQYVLFSTMGLAGEDIRVPAHLRINNGVFGLAPDYFALQLLYRVQGQAAWQYKDLTDRTHFDLCLETPEERAELLLLVISNGTTGDDKTPSLYQNPIIVAKDSCCPAPAASALAAPQGGDELPCGFSGSADYNFSRDFQDADGDYEYLDESASGSELIFGKSDETEPSSSDAVLYQLVSGSLDYEWRRDFKATGQLGPPCPPGGPGCPTQVVQCVETGAATIPLMPGEAEIMVRAASAGGLEYMAAGAVSREIVSVTASCVESAHNYEYDKAPAWFATGDWRPLPPNMVLEGTRDESSGNTTEVSTWNLTPLD